MTSPQHRRAGKPPEQNYNGLLPLRVGPSTVNCIFILLTSMAFARHTYYFLASAGAWKQSRIGCGNVPSAAKYFAVFALYLTISSMTSVTFVWSVKCQLKLWHHPVSPIIQKSGQIHMHVRSHHIADHDTKE